MKQEIINLVDKIIGKKGIMRSHAWWVSRIFKKTLDYSDKVAKDAESRANAKIDALEAGKEDKIMPLYVPEFMGDSYKSWMQDENKRLYDEIIAERCYVCKIVFVNTNSLGVYQIGTPMLFLGTVFISAVFPFEWSTSDDVLELFAQQIYLKSDGSVEVFQNANIPVLTRDSIIDNLDSNSGDYALSAKQGKVLKEMIEELPSGGTQDKSIIFYYPLEIQGEIREITEEQKAINAEGYAKVVNALINGMKPNIIIPLSEIQAGELSGISGGYGGSIPTQVLYIAPNTPLSEIYGTGLMVYITGDLYSQIIISEDGSVMTQKS